MVRSDADRREFEYLMDRHLSDGVRLDRRGREYVNLRDQVRMNARNLLSSHFHLVLWQKIPGGIERLMSRVLASYSRHYHREHDTSGPLYRGEYRARRIESPAQFRWRVGYVHDNHKSKGLDWEFSTHRQLVNPDLSTSALDAESTLKLFSGIDGYRDYMAKRAKRQALDEELRFEASLY